MSADFKSEHHQDIDYTHVLGCECEFCKKKSEEIELYIQSVIHKTKEFDQL